MTDLGSEPDDLWLAARDGDIDRVKYLLNQFHTKSDHINHRDNMDGTTPLIMALKGSQKYSFSHFDRTTRTYFDHTNRHLEVVKLLLYYKADVSVKCHAGKTALYWAVKATPSNEYLDIVLEAPGIDIDLKFDGCTALMLAVCNEYNKSLLWKHQVLALLDHGADTTTVDEKGNSLLHQMCSPGEWLLDTLKPFHIDINRKGEFGRTPLIYAIDFFKGMRRGCLFEKFTSVVKALLDHGADIKIEDDDGTTAIKAAESVVLDDHDVMLLLRETEFRDKLLVFATGTIREKNNPNCRVQYLYGEILKEILHQGK
jgi:hypothetical protein